ncbi:hypothetical protein VULLAG_LOCUS14254 [Vulpes lagopus]
MNMFL